MSYGQPRGGTSPMHNYPYPSPYKGTPYLGPSTPYAYPYPH